MKRIILFLFVLIISVSISKAQSSTAETYTIYCESLTTEVQSNALRNYLLTNFTEKISHYTANISDKSATIVTTVAPVDILQLYKQQGFDAIYFDGSNKFQLSPDGKYLHLIKEVH